MLLPMSDGRPLINADTLHDSIWFIPLIPIGTLIGAWMNKHVPEKPFAAFMYVAAAASAAYMIWTSSSWAAIGWGVAIIALAVGLLVLVEIFVIKRQPELACANCGHDLRQSKASGQRACPECGVAFAEVTPD
jgi:hypothetical protein